MHKTEGERSEIANFEEKYHLSVRPPAPLGLTASDVPKAWKTWIQQFKWYSTVVGLDKQTENVKIALFMSAIGFEAVNIFNTFPEDKKDTLENIINGFDSYFAPKVNITYERFLFNSVVQSANQKFDEFITELLQKSKTCEFGTLHDSLVTDRIVIGVYRDDDREKLLADDSLNLDKAVKICRATEQARNQLSSIKNETVKVEAVKKNQSSKAKWNKLKAKENSNQNKNVCSRCGTIHKKNECLAYKKECFQCHKEGHFRAFCKSKKISVIAKLGTEKQEHSREFTISSIAHNVRATDWYETVIFENGFKAEFKLDSGAQCDVIPKNLATKANIKIKQSKVDSLLSFSNHKIKVTGESIAEIQVKGKNYLTRFLVVEEDVQPVLGKDSSVQMELLKRIQTVGMTNQLMKTESSDDEIGCLKNFIYEIDLVDNPKLEIFPSRRVPHSLRDSIKKELDRMQKMGIITPVSSPTPAVSPMVIVRHNGKIRVCMDPSSLNKNLKRRHYPLNTLEEIAARINKSKWFTLLDCKKGFWQLCVTERTSKYLTMATPWGRYSYLRLPMGLSSAPEIFQQIMERLLGGKKGVECAMDDILIHAPSKAKLLELTQEVEEILRKAGLTLNTEKCVYAKNEVKFLGHIVTAQGLKADPDKIKAINNLKVPQDVIALQRLLGMVTYLAKFISNLSETTRPLRELCKKDVEWSWEFEHQAAFEKLKDILKNLPTLKYYDVNAPITLSVDASKFAVGAVIMQENRPIAYATKALDKTQQNYSQIEKEAFAIKFGCLRFHQYVWGCKDLTVETDHKPLTSISRKPLHCAPPRLQRIMLDIIPYRPNIVYKKGSELYVADTLSRDCEFKENNDDDDLKELLMEVHIVVPMTEARTQQLIQANISDEEIAQVSKLVLEGWPEDVSQVPETVKKYWTFKDEFAVYEGILFRGDRVVIPKELREPTLQQIHLGHLGIQRSLSRARDNVYWHGMTADIENYVKKCKVCQYHQRDK